MKDGFIENNAGNHRLDTVAEAIELNEALDKNFQDHKRDDYKKLIESNRLARKEKPSETWTRLDKQEKQRQKDHLNKLEHFGILPKPFSGQKLAESITALLSVNEGA